MIEYIDLKLTRTYAKMTTFQVARAMKKSQSWVTQIENGSRDIKAIDLQKLMKAYGLDDTPLNKIVLKNNKRSH